MPTLKIGLIRAGRIGCMHAEHLTSLIRSSEVVMVADAFEEAARQCAERCAIPVFAQDYHAVLDRADVQAVVICSSTDTHARIIEEAAQAGKHIFCEKPIALDLASIDRAFIDAVLYDTAVPVSGYDGRVPVVIALAAHRSLEEHRPVRLSEIE